MAWPSRQGCQRPVCGILSVFQIPICVFGGSQAVCTEDPKRCEKEGIPEAELLVPNE